MKTIIKITIILLSCTIISANATIKCKKITKHHITKQEQRFIDKMVHSFHFERAYMTKLIDRFRCNPTVIHKIEQPFERKPWYIYRKFFVNDTRARAGAIYWLHHTKTLAQAEKKYGVPASIIVAIVGIESNYGKGQGHFSVFNSLATLAFCHRPRALFFEFELEQYLLLSRKLNIDPTKLHGSYAGAIGYPQFMPSSYLDYAITLRRNKEADLLHNTPDVIYSIANFFKQAGWQTGKLIVIRAKIHGEFHRWLLNDNHNAIYKTSLLHKYGVHPIKKLPGNTYVNLIRFRVKHGYKYWLGLHDFYAITHYNSSPEYAMATIQLAELIKSYYYAKKSHKTSPNR